MATLPRRGVAAVFLAGAALVCISCGASGPRLHPVKGKVLYLNNPPQGATVVLQPKGGPPDAPRPSGKVEQTVMLRG